VTGVRASGVLLLLLAAGCRAPAPGAAAAPDPGAARDPGAPRATPAAPPLADLAAEARAAAGAVPLTFRLVNPGAAPRWVPAWPAPDRPPSCERRVGSTWQPCRLELPFCTKECQGTRGAAMCMRCGAAPPAVRQVPARGSLAIEWDGLLRRPEPRQPMCACFLREAPPAGRYRFGVCASASASCGKACPPPGPIGQIAPARVTGERRCVTTEVDLPLQGREVVITLE
jgi:hypothetical protein